MRINALGLNVGLYVYQAARWAILAVLPAIVVAVIGYQNAERQPKTYQATAVLYVQQPSQNANGLSTGTDPYASQQLAGTYSQMITDPTIIRAANADFRRKFPGHFIDGISASETTSAQGSQLFNETATDTDPLRASSAANGVARAFIHRIRSIQLARFQKDANNLGRQIRADQRRIATLEGQIGAYKGSAAGLQALRTELGAYQTSEQEHYSALAQFNGTRDASLSDVTLFSAATIPGGPTGPHPLRQALLWGFVTVLAGGALIFLYDYFNDLPRSPEDLEAAAGAPVLGTVQSFDVKRLGTPLVVKARPRSPPAEAYRLIRTNLQFANIDHPPRTIVVTSPLPAEGKSTTVANLAQVFAEMGNRVTLVDADLRRPSLHRVFPTHEGRLEGLTNILASSSLNGNGAGRTELANLTLVTSGPVPPNPADMLASGKMNAVIDHLAQSVDIVLIDTPPALAVADASIVSSRADGVVLVIDPHRTKRREVRETRETIEGVGGKILGIVMNKLRPRGAIFYHYYGYYGYRHGYKVAYDIQSEEDRKALSRINS